MFAYIKGTLVYTSSASVVIEASGIGYKVFIPAGAFAILPQTGTEVRLHLSFVVREQAQTLYGFVHQQERDFFESLLGVTGIGPKIALALIGHMPLISLQRAIVNQDVAAICRVPGIGKKGAERLIIEMRDKVDAIEMAQQYAVSFADPRTQKINDAMSALINLGYTQAIAQKAVQRSMKEMPEEGDLALLISSSLKYVS